MSAPSGGGSCGEYQRRARRARGLDVECVDRPYLNAYVPTLQVPGQVARFLHDHLGFPLPSPALFEKIGNRFRGAVRRFAEDYDIPILRLKKPDRTRWDDRKLDHVRPYLQAAEDNGRYGVVAIVTTQEFQWVFSGRDSSGFLPSSRHYPGRYDDDPLG